MLSDAIRLVIAGWVVVMLWGAGRSAWARRDLVIMIWSRIRWRHVAGSVVLLMLVATLASTLLVAVPGADLGLGSLLGFGGNAVFAPLEEAVSRAGPAPAVGPDWVLAGMATAFLGLLAALLPWLAFIEEEVFRAGLEDASLAREAAVAGVFGAAHLVMLVPLGAATAIAVAGFVYGRLYRRAYRRTDGTALPVPVARSFRPTKRSSAAADRARRRGGGDGTLAVVDLTPERRQASAVLASTVWHTSFNSVVVLLVWLGIVVTALT